MLIRNNIVVHFVLFDVNMQMCYSCSYLKMVVFCIL